MTKFSDLTTDDQMLALRGLAMGSFAAAAGALTILVARGLVSPEEFSRIIRPVADEIEKLGDINDEAVGKLKGGLDRLHALAAETWTDK